MQKALKINVFENIKDTTATQLLLNLHENIKQMFTSIFPHISAKTLYFEAN
jgi:hypothetical protein